MNVKGYRSIPNKLFYWITFLTKTLLSSLKSDVIDGLCCHSPLLADNQRTSGQIRKVLFYIFRHVRVSDWWNPTYKKIKQPDKGKSNDYYEKQRKAAYNQE